MVKVKVKQGRIGTVLQYLSCGALLAQCTPSAESTQPGLFCALPESDRRTMRSQRG